MVDNASRAPAKLSFVESLFECLSWRFYELSSDIDSHDKRKFVVNPVNVILNKVSRVVTVSGPRDGDDEEDAQERSVIEERRYADIVLGIPVAKVNEKPQSADPEILWYDINFEALQKDPKYEPPENLNDWLNRDATAFKKFKQDVKDAYDKLDPSDGGNAKQKLEVIVDSLDSSLALNSGAEGVNAIKDAIRDAFAYRKLVYEDEDGVGAYHSTAFRTEAQEAFLKEVRGMGEPRHRFQFIRVYLDDVPQNLPLLRMFMQYVCMKVLMLHTMHDLVPEDVVAAHNDIKRKTDMFREMFGGVETVSLFRKTDESLVERIYRDIDMLSMSDGNKKIGPWKKVYRQDGYSAMAKRLKDKVWKRSELNSVTWKGDDSMKRFNPFQSDIHSVPELDPLSSFARRA